MAAERSRKRLLFVPGFMADTYNIIQRRYVALDVAVRERLEMVWCLPPDDPAEWLWADPARQGERPRILTELEKIGARIVRAPVHRPSFFQRVGHFRRLLRAERFDGLFAAFGPRLAPLYAGHREGVTTIWDSSWDSLVPPHRMRFAKKFFYRWYIDYFVAVTEYVAETLVRNHIRPEQIFVRSNALDLDAIPTVDEAAARRRIREEFKLPADAEIVLQLTSFQPHKNVAMAVRVLKRLLEQRPNAYWLLVGEKGPEWQMAYDLGQKLGVGKHLIMPGHRRDIWDLNAAADVIVLTSCEEGLGNVLLEGMIAGRPVVTTRARGPETVVQDGEVGYVVPVDDDATFAGRLVGLLADPELRASFGRRGQAKVRRDLTLQPWCERLGAFLCQCVGVPAETVVPAFAGIQHA